MIQVAPAPPCSNCNGAGVIRFPSGEVACEVCLGTRVEPFYWYQHILWQEAEILNLREPALPFEQPADATSEGS